jgi:LmbE family N-acetylglucosaminyl deacetylase
MALAGLKKIIKPVYQEVKWRLIEMRLLLSQAAAIPDYESMLVIAPHPDDEVIGLGGLLVESIRAKKRIHVVYLTDGEKSLDDLEPSIVAGQRLALTRKVLSSLGLPESQTSRLHLPDGSIPHPGHVNHDAAVKQLEAILYEFRPDAVFVTHPLDTWPFDHVAAFELAVQAVRKSRLSCRLYGYWVWLRYSMPLNKIAVICWNDIIKIPVDDVMAEKRKLLDLYLKPACADGRSWSGELPDSMLKPFERPYEVVQRYIVS